MLTDIPSAAQIQSALSGLSYGQMQELARLSKVPFTTLWKVRSGETENPRIESVRQFLPHLEAARNFGSAEAAAQG